MNNLESILLVFLLFSIWFVISRSVLFFIVGVIEGEEVDLEQINDWGHVMLPVLGEVTLFVAIVSQVFILIAMIPSRLGTHLHSKIKSRRVKKNKQSDD